MAAEGEVSFASSEYMRIPVLIWRRLFKQVIRLALSLAALKTGSSNAARIAMMAMTTSNSIKVKPDALRWKDSRAWV